MRYPLGGSAPSNVNLPTTHAHMLEADELQAVNGDTARAYSPDRVSLVLHGLLGHFL